MPQVILTSFIQNVASRIYNWTFDNTVPTMTITAADAASGGNALTSGDLTNSNAAIYLTFTSSEDTTDFEEADITISASVGLAGSIESGSFTGSGKVYTATFNPAGGDNNNNEISVAINKFTDAAGNNNSVSNTFSWIVDTDSPTPTGNITNSTTSSSQWAKTDDQITVFVSSDSDTASVSITLASTGGTITTGSATESSGSWSIVHTMLSTDPEGTLFSFFYGYRSSGQSWKWICQFINCI